MWNWKVCSNLFKFEQNIACHGSDSKDLMCLQNKEKRIRISTTNTQNDCFEEYEVEMDNSLHHHWHHAPTFESIGRSPIWLFAQVSADNVVTNGSHPRSLPESLRKKQERNCSNSLIRCCKRLKIFASNEKLWRKTRPRWSPRRLNKRRSETQAVEAAGNPDVDVAAVPISVARSPKRRKVRTMWLLPRTREIQGRKVSILFESRPLWIRLSKPRSPNENNVTRKKKKKQERISTKKQSPWLNYRSEREFLFKMFDPKSGVQPVKSSPRENAVHTMSDSTTAKSGRETEDFSAQRRSDSTMNRLQDPGARHPRRSEKVRDTSEVRSDLDHRKVDRNLAPSSLEGKEDVVYFEVEFINHVFRLSKPAAPIVQAEYEWNSYVRSPVDRAYCSMVMRWSIRCQIRHLAGPCVPLRSSSVFLKTFVA